MRSRVLLHKSIGFFHVIRSPAANNPLGAAVLIIANVPPYMVVLPAARGCMPLSNSFDTANRWQGMGGYMSKFG